MAAERHAFFQAKRRWSLLAAAAVLAGCASPSTSPAPPAPLPLPAQWHAQPPASAPASGLWWEAFGDPVLTRLIQQALAHNTDIATAAARVQEARAQEDLARAARGPTLDFGASVTHSRTLNAFGKASTATTTQPVFQAAYEVDLFGRLNDQQRAAAFNLQASAQALDAARLSVAAATATGYITLRVLDARLAILQDTLTSRQASLQLARRRAEVGYTSDLEWRQAQAEYQATAQQIPPVRAAIARQEHALSVLTGQAPGWVDRGQPLAGLQPPGVPALLPSELLRRRPDIAQAESTLAASDATLAAARAQFLPQLRLTGSAGEIVSSSLGDPVAIWSLGASVLAPIFSAGRIQAQVETAAARREQAAWAYRRAVLTALREVEDNLAGVTQLRQQRTDLQAQREAVAEALRHASNRYRAGYSSFLEQLDAQRALLTTDLALAQAVGDELNALVALQQALGGGWSPQPLTAQPAP